MLFVLSLGGRQHVYGGIESDHHFLPALIPPTDFLLRIGIGWIVDRIVKVSDALNRRASREQLGLGKLQIVALLVVGHKEIHNVLCTVGLLIAEMVLG